METICVSFGRGGFLQQSSGQHCSSIYAHEHSFCFCASQDGKRAPCYFLEERCVDVAVSIQHEGIACTAQERCGRSLSSCLAQSLVHCRTDETTCAQPRTRTFGTSLCICQGRICRVQSIQQQQERADATDEPCDLLVGDFVAQRETKHRHVGTAGIRTYARGRPLPSTRLLAWRKTSDGCVATKHGGACVETTEAKNGSQTNWNLCTRNEDCPRWLSTKSNG